MPSAFYHYVFIENRSIEYQVLRTAVITNVTEILSTDQNRFKSNCVYMYSLADHVINLVGSHVVEMVLKL